MKTSDLPIPPPGFDEAAAKSILQETHSKKVKPEQRKIITGTKKPTSPTKPKATRAPAKARSVSKFKKTKHK